MCLLTFLPAGTTPDEDALHTGAEFNPDGHGYALITPDGRLLTGRGMDAPALIEEFTALRHQHPGGPALFHSRLATHGRLDLDNCHPFPVGGDPRTVVAHNGILPTRVHPQGGDRRCDTRIAAEEYLPTLAALRSPRALRRLERWMGADNKMVILTINPTHPRPAYLLNESSGIWQDGIWYSNDTYRPFDDRDRYHRWWQRPGFSPSARWWDGTAPVCGYCVEVLDDHDTHCPRCGRCPDCTDLPDMCRCHTPTEVTPPRRVTHRGRTS
jgi:glutamine amidotransferase